MFSNQKCLVLIRWSIVSGNLNVGTGRRSDVQLNLLDVPSGDFNPLQLSRGDCRPSTPSEASFCTVIARKEFTPDEAISPNQGIASFRLRSGQTGGLHPPRKDIQIIETAF